HILSKFHPTYLDAFTINGNEYLFLVSGRKPGDAHISEGGQIYELGVVSPYEVGMYPVLGKILEEKRPDYELELSLSFEADKSYVRTFSPVYGEDGELIMVIVVSQPWGELWGEVLTATLILSAAVFVILLLLVFWIVHLLFRNVVRPIRQEENVLNEYVKEKDTKKTVSALSDIKPDNEIQTLAETFSYMTTELEKYIDEIRSVTAEKERIGAELDMAAKIQSSQLPTTFPAFPERPEFDIYASMDPAKEVGGDFYDFFLIDEDHLALVIADVSGKGVPAALFMMASKILISNYSLYGKTPSNILNAVNERICERNEDNMFVTVWLGILEISSGKLTCCNAGHEYPVIKKAGGKFELLQDKHGLFVGAMAGVKYKDYEIQLEKGDTVFVYTDGVPEATNAELQLFGTERLADALNSAPEAALSDLLQTVRGKVDDFVGEAPQFDDLTMLALRYIGQEK
ncbi:MAG: SpoIIE family protein phosphatase, partial [Ruminiclostridium sp.]|nr:SpoIIE family protein phosphatase [Ruminiclostridium sp.]